jgi:hypothetical protein
MDRAAAVPPLWNECWFSVCPGCNNDEHNYKIFKKKYLLLKQEE